MPAAQRRKPSILAQPKSRRRADSLRPRRKRKGAQWNGFHGENDYAMDELRYFAATVAGRREGGGIAALSVGR